MLAAALQQVPLAEPPPAPRRLELDRQLTEAPRGWPHGPTIAMVTSMVGATLFGSGAFAMVAGFPFGVPGFDNTANVALFSACLASAAISVITAGVSFIVADVIANRRRAHVAALEAERLRLP